MTTPLKLGLASVVALALGFAIGAGVTSGRDAAPSGSTEERAAAGTANPEDLRRRVDAISADRDRLRRELDGLRSEVARLRDQGAAPQETAAAAGTAADPAPEGAGAGDERVRKLLIAGRAAIERGEGRAALTAARDLARIVPDGRLNAMELILELELVDHLDVGDVAWGAFLASAEVTELVEWSLGHPSPEAFREFAAESLPSLLPPEVVIQKFAQALLKEPDEDVCRSMVEGLIDLSPSGAEVALTQLFNDARVAVPVRVQIATHLSESDDPKVLDSIRAAADGAPPVLAAGIRAALAGRDATVTGFLVTGFVSGAAQGDGLEVGDVVISYDGRAAAEGLNAAIRAALDRDLSVRVEVLRAGARQTLDVQPGWLGLIGRVVHAPDDRR